MPDITPTMEKQRLLSLDFFRGVTVIAMIMVNNPGDGEHVYGILEHSVWNGCTPADLIFPFFLFIMGVSIPYAMERKKQIVPHGKLMLQVTRRSLILFALGVFLSLFPQFIFSTVRIPGILSKIGVVYFFCAWLYIRNSPGWQLWIFNFLLLAYYFLMILVPVPGVGYPNTNPGTNLATWLDRLIITDAHLYKPYSPYNPAELLTTLTAVATGISGTITGAWLRKKNRAEGIKVAYLAAAGLVFIGGGMIWGLYFPVNKLLWTSSFVLYSSGWAMIGLAVSYWLIDVQGYRKLIKPFVVYGVNAITVFFLSVLIKRVARMIDVHGKDSTSNGWDYLYQTFFEPFFNPYTASLAFAIVLVAGWMAVLWWMYNKRIIVKI
jgi:predicted acyltransferase